MESPQPWNSDEPRRAWRGAQSKRRIHPRSAPPAGTPAPACTVPATTPAADPVAIPALVPTATPAATPAAAPTGSFRRRAETDVALSRQPRLLKHMPRATPTGWLGRQGSTMRSQAAPDRARSTRPASGTKFTLRPALQSTRIRHSLLAAKPRGNGLRRLMCAARRKRLPVWSEQCIGWRAAQS